MSDKAGFTFRRFAGLALVVAAVALAYVLRGVLIPLFLAFLLAYALDPLVDRLEAIRVPRAIGALVVMLGIFAGIFFLILFAVPMFVDEIREVAAELPNNVKSLQSRVEPWLWQTFRIKVPHTFSEMGKAFGDRFTPMLSTAAVALFGTLTYVGLLLSALIVPVFALYLLIDFDRIVARVGELVPRRFKDPVFEVAARIHATLGGYVRGQITACMVLASLYAFGLRVVDVRLAIPIGIITGVLAFVPYVGFFLGLGLAMAMVMLDWHGVGPVMGVLAVMFGVQILDGMLITPRIVGRSVGLAPLEVLVTMMAAGSLFGFLGVLLAVPLGAVIKILAQRAVQAYLASPLYWGETEPPPQ